MPSITPDPLERWLEIKTATGWLHVNMSHVMLMQEVNGITTLTLADGSTLNSPQPKATFLPKGAPNDGTNSGDRG